MINPHKKVHTSGLTSSQVQPSATRPGAPSCLWAEPILPPRTRDSLSTSASSACSPTASSSRKQVCSQQLEVGHCVDRLCAGPFGRSRGFGFVTYESEAMARDVLQVSNEGNRVCSSFIVFMSQRGPHMLDGRVLDVKLAVPRGAQTAAFDHRPAVRVPAKVQNTMMMRRLLIVTPQTRSVPRCLLAAFRPTWSRAISRRTFARFVLFCWHVCPSCSDCMPVWTRARGQVSAGPRHATATRLRLCCLRGCGTCDRSR